ncbi:MAG: DeoR/GlpR family DNA-binding transcription regulator, partial [Pseudomonadota bacterium]
MLLERLAHDGQLLVAPLAAEFGVSVDTLRRDLRDLSTEGKLVRVHGGAVPASPTHVSLATRRTRHEEEKTRLARKAAELITDEMIVIIDGGSTHARIADALPRHKRCTVVTHSPSVATSFEFHDSVEVVLIGGRVFRHSMVAMSPETSHIFSRITADLCLLGVTGVHPELGLTTGDCDEAGLKRIMLDAAGETVVLATPDKIGRASPWQIEALSELS